MPDGKVQSGWCEINGKRYYADPKNYQIKRNGWYRIDGESYYFESDGSMRVLSGVVLRNKKRYYYDASTGEQKTGWVDVGKNRYYFSRGPEPLIPAGTGSRANIIISAPRASFTGTGGLPKKYYVDAEGVRQYGWITLDGTVESLRMETSIISTKKQAGRLPVGRPSESTGTTLTRTA